MLWRFLLSTAVRQGLVLWVSEHYHQKSKIKAQAALRSIAVLVVLACFAVLLLGVSYGLVLMLAHKWLVAQGMAATESIAWLLCCSGVLLCAVFWWMRCVVNKLWSNIGNLQRALPQSGNDSVSLRGASSRVLATAAAAVQGLRDGLSK